MHSSLNSKFLNVCYSKLATQLVLGKQRSLVISSLKIKMAGLESETAIFIGKAIVSFGRGVALCCWHQTADRPEQSFSDANGNDRFTQNPDTTYIQTEARLQRIR